MSYGPGESVALNWENAESHLATMYQAAKESLAYFEAIPSDAPGVNQGYRRYWIAHLHRFMTMYEAHLHPPAAEDDHAVALALDTKDGTTVVGMKWTESRRESL